MSLIIQGKTNWKPLLIIIILSVTVGIGILLYQNKMELISKQIEVGNPEIMELADKNLKEKIGQMIIIGFRGTEASEQSDIYKIIKDVRIGGVVLSDWDVPSNSFPRNIINPAQTRKLISDLKKYSDTPLFIGIDAEGGQVNRLKDQYGFISILSPEKMGKDKTLETTRKESEKIAIELKDLGFNMNLAPVVDVNINPKNPIIGALGRSFSSNSEEVINNARVFIEKHTENNIITVAKHFPGQGSATEDSHKGVVDVTDTYKDEELIPYQQLNSEGLLNVVMTAHIINKNIDDNPTTLSKVFLQDILRKQIGLKGVIMSDDLQMNAINDNYSFEDTIISAINAGCDIVYFFNNSSNGYDENIAYKIRDVIFNAVKQGKIEQSRITESYNRIMDLKKRFKIILSEQEKAEISAKIKDIKDKKFSLIGMPDIMTFAETLSIADYVGEITNVRSAFLLAVSQEELSLVNDYELCYVTSLETGSGKRISDNKIMSKTMHPKRDMKDFLTIAKDLDKNPYETPVTCPMEFGWGGAMGPLDFIPSTWMRYKTKIEEITGKPADPWNINDAFLAAGLYLSDSGANLQTYDGEWEAAMIYFSSSTNPIYGWYGDNTLKIADQLQTDIDLIK